MPFTVRQTSAENIIGATDAALQKPSGVDRDLVADFLDTTVQYAEDALIMGAELGFLNQIQPGTFVPGSRCSAYLATSSNEAKSAVLRFLLEQYEPYKTFKARLAITGILGDAATQTRAIHNIAEHRQIIMDTFSNLGTYAQSLVAQGGGLYTPREDNPQSYLRVLDRAIQERETAALAVRRHLGDTATAWVDPNDVLEQLVTAYQRLGHIHADSRSPIVHAANAVESCLAQLARTRGVNVAGSPGVNAKADALANAHFLTTKHKFILKYLGHVRNAADHGTDAEIGQQWQISQGTPLEFVHVALTAIRDLIEHLNNRFVV